MVEIKKVRPLQNTESKTITLSKKVLAETGLKGEEFLKILTDGEKIIITKAE